MTSGYLRYPHVHGQQLVFIADDDLWLGELSGGRAHRLTSHQAPARSPRFSPSGTRVAYVSSVHGGWDLHVVDLDGGEHRLTWLGSRRMQVAGWLDDEHVVIASNHAEPNPVLTSLYSVAFDGQMQRLPWGPAMAAAIHSDGRTVVASPNFRGPEGWKRYRGGMANRLWISDGGRHHWTRLLGEQTASLSAPFWFEDRICFTSDLGAAEGRMGEQAQLWSANPDGSDLTQHTSHSFDDGYVRDATTDGVTIVYHARGRLHALDSLSAEPRQLEIDVALGDPIALDLVPPERLEAVAPDHGGDGSVVDWRGTAWYLTHRGGPARALSALPGVRIREPIMLGASGKAAWATDAEGDDCIEIASVDADGDPRRIAHDQVGRVLMLASNAEGTMVGVVSHDGAIRTVDLAKGTVTQVGDSANGEATGLVFSPDGRYLVWREAVAEEGMLGRLVGHDTQSGEGFVLTRGQFNDFSPAFSADGKYLYFLSSRTIDPSYDELAFDLHFTHTVRPWVIPLRAEDQAPFGPSADGWNISEETEPKKEEGKDKTEEDKSELVVFDVDGAEERMVPLPVSSGRYVDLRTTANGVLWRQPAPYTGVLGAGKAGAEDHKDTIEYYDLGKRKLTTVVEGCDGAAVSGDGKQLVVRSGEEVWVQSAEAKPEDDDKVGVDLGRLRRRINPRDEWRQMFDENTRLMRDHFWREDMDGSAWLDIARAYRPLVERLATHDDLVDLLWETVGELNTSHAYVIPPEGTNQPGRGWLGAEFGRNNKGEVTIRRILQGESSDPDARSPLRAAGVAAKEGDVITAVDGQSTMQVPDIGMLLQGAADKVVELSLVRGRMKRRVAVVPVASEAGLRYHEWVARCAAYVDEQSGGRVGYVHVPDMTATGWAEFHRLIGLATRKEAVVADVRFNSGGHTSELIIERLARRVLGWSLGRHYEDPMPYPHQGIRGPLVFVTNPYAGSDGDIVTAVAQNLGLGPVVGERSWGGTVGIDGRFQLVDGTDVTQPRYGSYFHQQGWGLENWGTEPDIEVPEGPSEWESEADVQLDRAISEALRRLAEDPAAQPPALDAPRFGS